jgi:hypothetical protein
VQIYKNGQERIEKWKRATYQTNLGISTRRPGPGPARMPHSHPPRGSPSLLLEHGKGVDSKNIPPKLTLEYYIRRGEASHTT